jgi:hypothetical protein
LPNPEKPFRKTADPEVYPDRQWQVEALPSREAELPANLRARNATLQPHSGTGMLDQFEKTRARIQRYRFKAGVLHGKKNRDRGAANDRIAIEPEG